MNDGVDKGYLAKIVAATAANVAIYVGQVMGQPMLAHNPPLIEINTAVTNPDDSSQVLCRATEAAAAYLAADQSAPAGGNGEKRKHTIMTGIVLPEAKKRGNFGSGAPSKYPFGDMAVGDVFFSGNSEHTKGDAMKALGSTVSVQNDKYSKPKMENGAVVNKTVTRAVRDKATKKAQIGPDGKKVTETVQLPVKEYERKFTIRPVPAGYQSGDWVAPEAGVLIARIK